MTWWWDLVYYPSDFSLTLILKENNVETNHNKSSTYNNTDIICYFLHNIVDFKMNYLPYNKTHWINLWQIILNKFVENNIELLFKDHASLFVPFLIGDIYHISCGEAIKWVGRLKLGWCVSWNMHGLLIENVDLYGWSIQMSKKTYERE